jgi:hypothetical protein
MSHAPRMDVFVYTSPECKKILGFGGEGED